MIQVLKTKNGYGVKLVEEARMLIEGLPHNQAVTYARAFLEVEENTPKRQGRPEKQIKILKNAD